MNRHCNTSVIAIQSGVTTSGQVYRYQVIACQLSGVRSQV